MPFTSLATPWQQLCGHHLTAQLRSARTGPSSSLQVESAACRNTGRYPITGSNSRGGWRRCNMGWGGCTTRLHSRPPFAPGSQGVAKKVARQPSSSSSSSGSAAQPCPLHACLVRYGITDLVAFSAPRHLALSQEAVNSDVEPKLAALEAEGLSPEQIMALLSAKGTSSLLSCSYKDTFLPNMQLLQRIRAYTDHRPHPKTPNLTAAGKILTVSPSAVARYLSRDPHKVQQLLQWLEGSLGVGLEELAACKALCNALYLSAGAASAVFLSLQNQGVPAEQVAHMLLKQPTVFNRSPEALSARLVALQQHLGVDPAAALQLALSQPRLLNTKLEASLPPLLRFLDGYMGEEGAGRRLVRAQPVLGTVTAKTAECSIANLATRGYSQQQIRGIVCKHPGFLNRNLNSPLQQQKLGWIQEESPWTLDDFLATPTCLLCSTCRLAARLAFLRECGLRPPATPSQLAGPSSASFTAAVRKQLARQGRELPWASWAEWEEAWLGTEEGRKWGFPPLTD
ncbi:hypothetical protein N2152v2_009956 [Parachlorella kessleri]